MQADYWDSTIFLGDAGAAIAAAEPTATARDPARRISRELLLPQGRAGGWAVFFLVLCGVVVFQALHVRFA